jgi:glutamate-1-semialdehyde 2,1-aminomutase
MNPAPGPRSVILREEAERLTPGGIHSNVRMAGPRIVIERAKGAWLYDVDGNDYVDHLLGQGPNFLGHAPDVVLDAVDEATRLGMIYGGQHPLENEAARLVLEATSWPELIRFGVSGTEMVHAALRLARAHTGRRRIIRFEGHYHGWLDDVLMADNGSGWGPASEGQNRGDFDQQIILPWNDEDAVNGAYEKHGHDIAAVITEPMMVNVGAIEPRPGYLAHLRSLTAAHGSVLIFDEVISGFRLALGGAAARYGVTPDLAVYGKALAGGWPAAALAGKGELMERLGTGEVNHSGTFNSSVMAMAAVVAAITELQTNPPYDRVDAYGRALMDQLGRLAAEHGLELHIQGVPSAFHSSFGDAEVYDASSASQLDNVRYSRFAQVLVAHGVWVAGRGVWYTSAAHGDAELGAVTERVDSAMSAFTG